MPIRLAQRWPIYLLLLICAAIIRVAAAADIEAAIQPTVHATLSPTSAIQVPLYFSADRSTVWKSDLEQRMLLGGHVSIAVGYRTLRADDAAIWLTPSRESGESIYDVAIYLSGNVQVREGNSPKSTVTVGKELLVTTRILQIVQLSSYPVSKSDEDSPIVKRGGELRQMLLTRPAAPAYIPILVTTTPERALQSGWIAHGDNNRLIPGPGSLMIVRDAQGNVIPGSIPPLPAKPPRPAPTLFVVSDGYTLQQVSGGEMIQVARGPYVIYNSQDGKPPLEFRAQRMVAFGPMPKEKPASTEPAATQPSSTQPAGTQPATKPRDDISTYVTGIYLEGDVTLDQGNQLMVRADRIYYDFTSQRAIMLDATLATIDEQRNVPVYLRATEIRQLARGEFAAKKVTFSTSEFYVPHYHIGASEIYLRDVTPSLISPGAGQSAGPMDMGFGGNFEDKTYQFEVKDATINIAGVPVFYWPFLGGDTSKNEIPLRTIRVSNSKTYGLSLLTDWDLFALAGQPEPKGVRADLNLDYFGKRGPGGGVQAAWQFDDDHGALRSYAILDHGEDRLGVDREDLVPPQEQRGRVNIRDQRDLGDGLTLQLEAAYASDPNFLEQYFQREFDVDKEQETSAYLKKQGETDALTLLLKADLMDFTTIADQVDDQFTTQKVPEVKYWRIGDSLLDMFTYYSETSGAYLHSDITDFTPNQIALYPAFMGLPASVTPLNTTYRDFYRSQGWTTGSVVRADTRQEIDMPLQIGDAKVTPYLAGRATIWDQDFPEVPVPGGSSGTTTRLWGGAGIRASMQFWRVYNDVQSVFFDIHNIRHVIEPQFHLFVGGATQDRSDLQPFERDVEGISAASGTQLSLHQKWQTKRGGEGHWRDVDWITLDIAWNQFWNKDKTGTFFPQQAVRGFFFPSRPELSLVQNSINIDGIWRVGERARVLGDVDFSLDTTRVEQFDIGVAVDQTSNLSYFFGNRYIHDLNTDEWTIAMDYQLTRKYELIAAESYDFQVGNNILSSLTFIRRLPRFNTALTVSYDANNGDTSVVFSAWPEGFPNTGFGNVTGASNSTR